MTRKRLFALLAVLCLVGFFGVILLFVPRTDLSWSIHPRLFASGL